nr:hypothetical protein [Desulfovibrionaceae bacterium]
DTAIEVLNLLYVALTRAKKELYIIIVTPQDTQDEKEKKSKKDTTPELSFSRFIRHIIEDEKLISKHNLRQTITTPEKIIHEYSTIQEVSGDITQKKQAVEYINLTQKIVEPHTHKLLELPPFDIDIPEAESKEESRIPLFTFLSHFPQIAPLQQKKKNAKIERGLLFHKALEYISMDFSIEHAIQCACNDKDTLDNYQEELSMKLHWFISQEYASTCLQKGLAEQTMITKEGKELRADKIIEQKDEWIVIEYKTGSATTDHIQQITEYMHVLQDIRNKKTRSILIYFDEQKELPPYPDTIEIYTYQNIT